MKYLLTSIGEFLADLFRELDYSEANYQNRVSSYAAAAKRMEADRMAELAEFHPVPREQAMQLVAGSVYEIVPGAYFTDIHDVSTGNRFDAPASVYRVHGSSRSQVEDRAAQLVSALDGARRL